MARCPWWRLRTVLLSEKEQKAVAAAVSEDKVKLNPKNAAAIRAESGNITRRVSGK